MPSKMDAKIKFILVSIHGVHKSFESIGQRVFLLSSSQYFKYVDGHGVEHVYLYVLNTWN